MSAHLTAWSGFELRGPLIKRLAALSPPVHLPSTNRGWPECHRTADTILDTIGRHAQPLTLMRARRNYNSMTPLSHFLLLLPSFPISQNIPHQPFPSSKTRVNAMHCFNSNFNNKSRPIHFSKQGRLGTYTRVRHDKFFFETSALLTLIKRLKGRWILAT